MKKQLFLLVSLLLLLADTVKSEPVILAADLSAAVQFPPPNLPPGINPTGYLWLSFDLETKQLQFTLTWSGLSSNATAAALRPYQFGPILAGLLPSSSTFGTEGQRSGTISLSADQIALLQSGIQSGLLFVDFYTVRNISPGEMAGRLAAVPEPATIVLISSGLAIVIARRRRKQRSDRCEGDSTVP